jgi:hypothetical protein
MLDLFYFEATCKGYLKEVSINYYICKVEVRLVKFYLYLPMYNIY